MDVNTSMITMRHFINLFEDFEDDDGVSVESMPSIKDFMSIRPKLVPAIQDQYDQWDQDEDGYDEEVGNGGICHLIADRIIDVAGGLGVDLVSVSSTHEQHVYTVGAFREGVFEIDVPHRIYERGAAFTWTKLPGVVFEPDDITVTRLSPDPGDINDYIDAY